MSKTNVKGYTDKQLLDRVKGLSNFKSIPKDYWILGVRSNEDAPDVYDDKFYLFKGEKCISVATGTTNPGVEALVGGWKKNGTKGAFILKSDYWHHGIWKGGMHKLKMKALVQVGVATGYRDNDNDKKSEELGNMLQEKWIGINFHTNTYNTVQKVISWVIGGWSYGCQVINDKAKYQVFVDACYNQKTTDYVLINEF